MKTPWSNDGVALTSIAHPESPNVVVPENFNEDALETVEIDAGVTIEELSREFFALYNACTFAMEHVRIRVSHAGDFRLFAMRADDKLNPCGEIRLSDGSTVRVEVFGSPSPQEPIASAAEIMQQIIDYIRSTGLTIPN